ncbi:Type I restriction modification DNA specificity domain protein [anaerobic digester metagenome]
MNSETKHLKDVVKYVARGITPSYDEKGVRVINQRCIRDKSVKLNDARITNPDKKKITEKKFLRKYDVLVNSTGIGTLGRVAQIKDDLNEPLTADSHVTIVRPDQMVIDGLYFGYVMINAEPHITFLGEGSTGQIELSRKRLASEIEINVPDITTQKKIASILSSIDQKIDINLQMNQTLEEIGQAMFKHWFVHYEFPNENELPYKSSGGKMVDSELGKIPIGWKVGKIKDLLVRITDTVNPLDYPNKLFFHYSIPSYDSGKTPIKELGNQINSQKFVVKKNSILVSKLNPDIPRIWAVRLANEELSICSTEFQVLVPKIDKYSFVYYLFHSNYVKETMIAQVTGTSKSHQRIRPDDILNIEIVIPPKDYFLKFEELFKEFISLSDINITQNKILSKIRDSLLPKLISGKIRVKPQEEATAK